MKIRLLVIFASITFVLQIVFSIYYSIKIVDENTEINDYQKRLNESKNSHQKLQNQFSERNSLKYIKTFQSNRTYIPINSSLNLLL